MHSFELEILLEAFLDQRQERKSHRGKAERSEQAGPRPVSREAEPGLETAECKREECREVAGFDHEVACPAFFSSRGS